LPATTEEEASRSMPAITPIFLVLLWRRQLYGQRRFYAITN
jgi:hypothetical protein